jgi:hypothetical protein
MQPAISVNVNNLTPAQFAAIHKILTVTDQESEDAAPVKRAKKSKPAATVSDDEDEEFAKAPVRARELEEDEEVSEDDEDETEVADDEDEDEDEEPSVTFAEVKAAINKYGEKHPDQMRAILLGFNIKGPKELAAKGNEKYWQPVYRKVMAKLKASKKAK